MTFRPLRPRNADAPCCRSLCARSPTGTTSAAVSGRFGTLAPQLDLRLGQPDPAQLERAQHARTDGALACSRPGTVGAAPCAAGSTGPRCPDDADQHDRRLHSPLARPRENARHDHDDQQREQNSAMQSAASIAVADEPAHRALVAGREVALVAGLRCRGPHLGAARRCRAGGRRCAPPSCPPGSCRAACGGLGLLAGGGRSPLDLPVRRDGSTAPAACGRRNRGCRHRHGGQGPAGVGVRPACDALRT